jgi:hypothetical protein
MGACRQAATFGAENKVRDSPDGLSRNGTLTTTLDLCSSWSLKITISKCKKKTNFGPGLKK